ncbi:MAG: ABC transporter permease [Ruminococcus sp.]|nr:ABC transporter permease [Ruminococcus sp.]
MTKRKGLGFYLRIYGKILTQDIKSKMSYRADFIISTIGMIFTNLAGFISFWILFRNFPSINGWGYYEMLFLYGFSLIALTPVQCLFDNNWSLRMYVYSGDFIKYCFRPINLFFYYQSEIFDIKGLGQLAFGIGTLVYSWAKLELDVTFLAIVKTIVFLFTASLVMIALQNAAAATCFWIQNSFFVLDLVLKFKDYAKYPITIFSPVFKFIFTFIIPIAFIAYYPSLVILRPDEIPILSWISPLIGMLFFFLSYKFWMFGATRYSGTGS